MSRRKPCSSWCAQDHRFHGETIHGENVVLVGGPRPYLNVTADATIGHVGTVAHRGQLRRLADAILAELAAHERKPRRP